MAAACAIAPALAGPGGLVAAIAIASHATDHGHRVVVEREHGRADIVLAHADANGSRESAPVVRRPQGHGDHRFAVADADRFAVRSDARSALQAAPLETPAIDAAPIAIEPHWIAARAVAARPASSSPPRSLRTIVLQI
jgi:hypothetical protein